VIAGGATLNDKAVVLHFDKKSGLLLCNDGAMVKCYQSSAHETVSGFLPALLTSVAL